MTREERPQERVTAPSDRDRELVLSDLYGTVPDAVEQAIDVREEVLAAAAVLATRRLGRLHPPDLDDDPGST